MLDSRLSDLGSARQDSKATRQRNPIMLGEVPGAVTLAIAIDLDPSLMHILNGNYILRKNLHII